MRKRSAYKPKPVIGNPVAFVIGLTGRVASSSGMIDFKIKNYSAMASLMQGTATAKDMSILIEMSNICEAMREMGIGDAYESICTEGRYAICKIAERKRTHGRYTPTGIEMQALRDLLELHDAQMEVATVRDLWDALKLVRKRTQSKDRIFDIGKLQ